MSSILDPNVTIIPPILDGTAFCIASPRSLKSFIVSEKFRYPAADKAEYSPNE